MRALVVYSSKTGNTKAIAEVAAEAFGHDTVLAPIAEAPDYHEFDLVAVGFWIDKGHPNHEIQKYIRRLKGKKVVLNIFPSLDTAVCATSVRKFNELAAKMDNTVVLAISKDLPFAQARFCTTEDIENVEVLSAFRNTSFGKDYGVALTDGPLAGLFARAVVVLDETGKVVYSELVPEITTEPNYDQALKAL